MRSSLDSAWRQQSIWSQVSDRLKSGLQRRRWTALALTIAGSVFAATAAGLGLSTAPGKSFAFLAAACVGIAAIVQSSAGITAYRDWTRARSISEALKSEVYSALAGHGAADFDATVRQIVEDGADLRVHQAGIEPVARPLPAVHDIGTYLAVRVGDQIEKYYKPKAKSFGTVVRVYRGVETGLAVIGVVLAATAGTWEIDWLATWVPVVTTISAAVVAHAAAERSSYQLVEYLRTRDELSRVLQRAGGTASLTDEELVRHAESVISAQNDAWMAKLTGDDTGRG